MTYVNAVLDVPQASNVSFLRNAWRNRYRRTSSSLNLRGTVRALVNVMLVTIASSTLAVGTTSGPAQANPDSDGSSQLNARTPSPASAADHTVVFLGGQADSANVAYLGATVSLPGSVIGGGFAVRVDGFSGDYGYNSGTLGSIGASFDGGEFDGVYQISSRSYWTNFAVGVRDVDTKLAPFDVTNRRRGQVSEFATSLDGGGVAGPYRADYYASYGAHLDDYEARASVTHTVSKVVRLGAEVSFEGDPTYSLRRVGPYGGFRIDGHSELQISAGVSQQAGDSSRGYFRLGIYRSF